MAFAHIEQMEVFLHTQEPLLVGRLEIIQGRLYFEYDASYRETGVSLSPFALPLEKGAKSCEERHLEHLHGVFNDSLPDGWGKMLIDRYLSSKNVVPETLTPLDRLSLTGLHGMGALSYIPDNAGQLEVQQQSIIDLALLYEEIQETIEDESDKAIERLLKANGPSGGARPKALIQLSADKSEILHGFANSVEGYDQWIVKFGNSDDDQHSGNIEYAYALMAKAAGLNFEEIHLFKTKKKDFFATKRFDRTANTRIHTHSLCGLVHSDFRVPSLDYEDVLTVTGELTRNHQETTEAFRIACFNAMVHNKDDHEKNISFQLHGKEWRLAPAYDLTFSQGPGGWHSITFDGEGKKPQAHHLQNLAERHGIKNWKTILHETSESISRWETLATEAGVPDKKIAQTGRVLDQRVKEMRH